MLIQSFKQITYISDKNEINLSNYIESLNYVDNLYMFLDHLKKLPYSADITFEPSFKGKNTCEKYNIQSTETENEMRLFILKSEAFLEDEKRAMLESEVSDIIEFLDINGTLAKIVLKGGKVL